MASVQVSAKVTWLARVTWAAELTHTTPPAPDIRPEQATICPSPLHTGRHCSYRSHVDLNASQVAIGHDYRNDVTRLCRCGGLPRGISDVEVEAWQKTERPDLISGGPSCQEIP